MTPTLWRGVLVLFALSQVLLPAVNAQSIVREIVGQVPFGAFGVSVASVGDLNGDAIPELLVGSYDNDLGAARVFSGADGSLLRTHTGAHNSLFAFALNSVGDVNRDGFPDYAVGAPYALNYKSIGAVAVYSGKDGSLLYAFTGDEPNDLFGEAVDAAGDVNQDGFADILVGAPFFDPLGRSTKGGFVRVFSGKDGSVLHNISGNRAGEQLGISVSGMGGDLDGDGYDDFIATSPLGPFLRAYSGKDAHVLFATLGGTSPGSRARSAGDVNGDGTNDIVLSVSWFGTVFVGVYSGKDGSSIYSYQRADSSHGLNAVTGAGDVNGDGYSDFLIGSAASGYVGTVDLMSGRTGLRLYEFRGDNPEDAFGVAVTNAGDLNRDGRPDLCIGAPNFSQAGNRVGKVVVYSGNDLFLLATPRTVHAANTLQLDTREGAPGDPTVMAVVEVNGTPFFTPIFGFASLDASGGRGVSALVPSGLSGLSFCLKSFTISSATLRASDKECIVVQ